MGIVVQHEQGPASVSGIATALGQGQAATRNAALDEDRARFILSLQENRRNNDINVGLRLRAQDIEQRQYNTNLALQDARQQQLAQNAALNRQAQLESQAMRQEYDVYQQQMAQQHQYGMQAAKTLDEQVFDVEKEAQQLKLNPEGQRILNEKIGALRAIKEQSAMARPDVRAALLDRWMSDYRQANLPAYEVQEPTAQQKVFDNLVPLQGQQIVPGQPLPPGTYRSLKGTRNGVDSWETITIPKEDAATVAERFQRDSFTAPDGRVFLWNPDKQDWTSVAPVKPEKAEKPVDPGKYVKEAIAQLRADHAMSQADAETKTPFTYSSDQVKKKAKEIMDLERELQAEMAAETGGAEPTTTQPPIQVSSPDEAAQLPIGGTFIFNGQTFRVTGPGQAEPL